MEVDTSNYSTHAIWVELQEIQHADVGRRSVSPVNHVRRWLMLVILRYVSVDRRPLEPPPVVAMKQYDVYDAQTPQERRVYREPE
jgi:hypothetical protein